MKKFLFISLALVIGIMSANANNAATGLQYSGTWLSAYDSIVVSGSGSFIVTMAEHTSDYVGWGVSGDLRIDEEHVSATEVQIYSTGSAKGRVYYYYDDNPSVDCHCGVKSVALYVYKQFDPNLNPYNLEISGPDCILSGDTVVYSIDPILTKNLNQGIGMDEYNWQFSGNLAQQIIYNAGDGSSVTFIVGEVTGTDQISVQVGLANGTTKVVKNLGKAAPKPLVSDTCIPFDQKTFEINIFNEQYPDLYYSWEVEAKWSITYPSHDENRQKKYHAVITPKDGDGGQIVVTASYGNNDACSSAGRASFFLSRSWGLQANVTPQGNCAKNQGAFIAFKLSEEFVSDEVTPIWEIPTTWEKESGTDDYKTTYSARPINSTRYIDTIKVWEDNCGHKDSCIARVYIAPARVDSISKLTCIESNDTYTFTIERLGVGPQPVGYSWYIDGVLKEENGGNSYTGIFTSDMRTLAARSLGLHGCHADTTQIPLSFRPTAPDSMSINDTCWFTGENNTTEITVHNRKSGVEYSWVYPEGWTEIPETRTDSSITLLTDGTGGIKRIGVYASSTSDCGNSDTLFRSIQVDTTSYEILYSEPVPGLHMFTLYDNITHQNAIADWEINGEPQPFSKNSIYTYRQNSIPDSVKAIVTRPSGCTKNVLWLKQEYFQQNQSPVRVISEIRHMKMSNRQNITLYPNPAKNVLTITKDDELEYLIFLLDINGKLLKTFSLNEKDMNVDISDLPNGSYSVVFTDGVSNIVKKLIINH